MQDGILKGTGNSRYLKTVQDALTLYPTYESFMAAFVAGTLPADLNGVNPAGWELVGTALNKGNLLHDLTAANLGLTPAADATPAQVLEALRSVATRDTGNLLINSDFRNPIDDRGGYVVPPNTPYSDVNWTNQVGVTDRYYAVKRWVQYSNLDPMIEIDGVEYVCDHLNAVRGYVGAVHNINGWLAHETDNVTLIHNDHISITRQHAQIIDPAMYDACVGKTLTISALTSKGLIKATGVCSQNDGTQISATDGNSLYVSIYTNSGYHGFQVNSYSGDMIDLYGIKVEIGSTQTVAHQDENGSWVLNDLPPNRALEALKCATSTADMADTHSGMFAPCAKLVWENASPDIRFFEQTIPIDLSAYDAVMVVTNEGAAPSVVKMGESRWVFGTTGPNTGGVQIWFRRCTVSVDSVYFGRSTHSPQEAYLSDGWCVPLRIYGIKGVSA